MLFNEEELYGVDESAIDNTEISTTLLYYSKEEMAEFKRLCKAGMKKEFPETFQDSNISDLILTLLKKNYAEVDA